MTTYLKIADNEMNYFQNKAREMLLLKKEDREWGNFCKQIAPECAACSAEKTKIDTSLDSKVSKDVGIQAFPRKTFNKIERPTLDSKYQKEQIPEALNNIKTRLEKIDFALSKIYDVSYESDKKKEPASSPILHNKETLKSLDEQRKLLIQNSLKASLQKVHTSCPRIEKNSPSMKLKNPSYFLPHDLKVKRAVARKAYLVSLQTKPTVSFKNMSHNKKNVQSIQSKKSVPKHTSKPKLKKKGIPKSKELSVDKEETLISSTELEETKDQNIELIVDGILEDLIGEAALDLNKIKQGKRHVVSNALNNETDKVKNTVPLYSLTSSPTKDTIPKVLVNSEKSSMIKLFFDPSEKEQRSGNSNQELIDKTTTTFQVEDPKNLVDEIAAEKNSTGILHKKIPEIKDPPKFVCGVSNIITVDPEKAKDILEHKERFWKYLKNISRRVKGNFNPWILNETLAESILDECIKDIAEELSEMPSNFIQDLYNQEFVQQVED